MDGTTRSVLAPVAVVTVCALFMSVICSRVEAQSNAKFTAVVGGVTYRPGGQANWRAGKAGTPLASGARVRTDRRGKCEIKFPGGSLVRMPPSADLVLTSVTQNHVKLLSGQVLTNAVQGSAVKIQGASATASVQGTWVLFTGEDMSVWDGTATLETPLGKQQVGDQQRAGIVQMQLPLVGEDGMQYGEVSVRPTEEHLVIGFRTDAPWLLARTAVSIGTSAPERFDPSSVQFDHPNVNAGTDEHEIVIADLGLPADGALFLVAYAELVGAEAGSQAVPAWAQGEPIPAGGMYFEYSATAAGPEYPWEFPTGSAKPWWYGMQPGVSTVATPGTDIGMEMRNQRIASYSAVRETVFSSPTHGRLGVGVESVGAAAAVGSSSIGALPLVLALSGQVEPDEPAGFERLGKRFLGPRSQVDLFGVLGSSGSFAGGRARVAGVYGPVYAELGGQFSTQFEGEWDCALSEAFAVWRTGRLDITAGRQHYLDGPVNNSPLGAQFGALTFDGIRAHYQGEGFSLDGIWLEGYDRGLVEPGEGEGWLGRASVPLLGGQLGLNVLRELGADTGVSLDFSLPAVPRVIDIYGEFGQDPWEQNFETWGFYSPWVFDRSGVDVFIEYAQRESYPDTWSAMAYKDVSGDWSGLAGFRKVEGDDCEFSIGIARRLGTLGK